jgi:formate dehydrogenase gamma subunit
MIIVLVGAMTAHNLAVWLRKAIAARRAADRSVLRMDRSQRTQHLILLTSFILLALTGFALKYPDSWLAWMFGYDETIRRWLHRVAGVALLLVGTYHAYYVMVTAEGRRLVRDLWPSTRDVRDAAAQVRYLAGKAPAKPKFGRFGYAEKMEYWAVLWGTMIMGVTGLMIWLKIDVTRLLPRWAVEVATTIHYYEAILACLAIVVWHFYHVIFDPSVYPVNWAWWDGKVSSHWHQEEHPLDTAAREESAGTDGREPRGRG